tara:strand:+ start:233 stop:724 length:492 start_codon:yes stop_codon:yes gene_type:complete
MLNTKNELPDMTDAYAKVVEEGKKKDRWQDDDGDGKWYEKSDTDGKISKREKEEKKKNQKEEVEVKEAMLLTKADKKGNTPAWQNRDKKNVKTGEPIYKKADHLKNEEVEEVEEDCDSAPMQSLAKGGKVKKVKKEEFEALKTSGLFSEEELGNIFDLDNSEE